LHFSTSERRHPVRDRETCHGKRVIPVLGTVVDAGKQVAVDVDKWFWHGAGLGAGLVAQRLREWSAAERLVRRQDADVA
jgi:hypothetical protein